MYEELTQKIDKRIEEMQKDREAWEADFDKRMESMERETFPRRIAESAFDIVLAALAHDESSEFDPKVHLPAPEWVASYAWRYADAMDAERAKRGFPAKVED